MVSKLGIELHFFTSISCEVVRNIKTNNTLGCWPALQPSLALYVLFQYRQMKPQSISPPLRIKFRVNIRNSFNSQI